MRSLDFPEIHPKVAFSERGETVFAMSGTNEPMEMSPLQVDLLRRCDGHTEIGEIASGLSQEHGEEISVDDLTDFLAAARKLGLLSLSYAGPADEISAKKRCRKMARRLKAWNLPVTTGDSMADDLASRVMERLRARDPRGALSASHALKEVAGHLGWVSTFHEELERLGDPPVMGEFDPFQILIPLADPERILVWLDQHFGRFFNWGGLLVWAAYVLAGVWATANLKPPPLSVLLRPDIIAIVWLGNWVRASIHEFGHSLTCRHYGQTVKRMGIGVQAGILPMAWADVTRSYLIPERWKRVLVLTAGVMTDFFVLGTMSLVAVILFPPESTAYQSLAVLVITNVGIAEFMNLCPLYFKLDGYYILGELTRISNIEDRAADWARAVIARFWVREAVEVPETSRRERWVFSFYCIGSAALVAVLVVVVSQALYERLVGKWRGYGLALFLAVLSMFFGNSIFPNVLRGIRFLAANARELVAPHNLRRTGPLVAFLFAFLFLVRLPESSEATFVVQPAIRAEVRARIDGQLRDVLVRAGEHVQSAQPLVRLENTLLLRRRVDAMAELDVALADAARILSGPRTQERQAAKAATREAQVDLAGSQRISDREAKLGRAGLVSHAEVEQAVAQLRDSAGASAQAQSAQKLVEAGSRAEDITAAQAKVHMAQLQLDEVNQQVAALTVVSPAAGVIADMFPEEQIGRLFRKGDPILTVQSDDRFTAELVAPWIANPEAAVRGTAKLFLPSGVALSADISGSKIMREGPNAPLILETTALSSTALRAKIHGQARVYGERVSIFTEYIWHPLKRFFVVELWGSL